MATTALSTTLLKRSVATLPVAVLTALALTIATPSFATQPPQLVKPPSIQPYPKERPNRYHRDRLPHHVEHAIISGAAYAIVDNRYYRQQGEYFIYTAAPPHEGKISVSTGGMGKNQQGQYGKVLDQRPTGGKNVTIDGIDFWVVDGIWHAPLQGGKRYVVVQPQL